MFMLSPFKFIVGIAIAVAPTMMAAPSYAQQEVASDAGEVVLNATINTIDVENQLLTLTGPLGNTIVVKAAPEVLGSVKINEQITIRYADEVAMALRKVEDAPPANSGNVMEREETGGMNMNPTTVAEQNWVEAAPQGETDLNTIEVTATVANVDYGARILTFKGPNGAPRIIKAFDSDRTGVRRIKRTPVSQR
jgi:hypothetical protein